MPSRSHLSWAAAIAILTAGAAGAQTSPAPAPAYSVTSTIPVGGPDQWDYVIYDAPSHRVYLAHGDRISVVDGRSAKLIGEVAGVPGGSHGIAISHATGQGYTATGRGGQVAVFDLKTLKLTAQIPGTPLADAMAFDPVTGHVFVIEGDVQTIAAIDPATNKIVATIDAGGKLEYAAADGRGSLYVAGLEKREVVRVDTRTNTVTAHWAIPDCVQPHGLALDTQRRRVFVSCVNEKLVVLDTDNGHEVGSAPIGRGTDAASYDPSHKRVFSANGMDGTLSVIAQTGPNAYALLATIPTQASGRTMAVDPTSGRVFIAAADTAPGAAPTNRPKPLPGTLKLLILDPAK
jgi:DNA-binding beta-propeller fold protein YncE